MQKGVQSVQTTSTGMFAEVRFGTRQTRGSEAMEEEESTNEGRREDADGLESGLAKGSQPNHSPDRQESTLRFLWWEQ